MIPLRIFARGGGGGHGFGGGYHKSFSYHDGHYIYYHYSNAEIWNSYFLLAAIVIFAIYQNQKDGINASLWSTAAGMLGLSGRNQPSSISSPRSDIPLYQLGLAGSIQHLQQSDPGFDLERFLQRAEMTYMLLCRAEIANNVADGQALLTPHVFAFWCEALQRRKELGFEYYFHGLNIRRIDLESILLDNEGFDTLTLHLDVVAGRCIYDPAHDMIVSGSAQENGYGIRLSLTRKVGAQTLINSGVIAKKCPSCAAPLNLTDDGTCSYCHIEILSGNVDWSVSGLEEMPYRGCAPTQDRLLTPIDPRRGLAALRERDPNFDEARFLRRVEAMFFAVQAAWQDRNPARAQAYMSEGLFLAWRTQTEQLTKLHRKNILDQLQILSVQPVGMISGTLYDTITLEIQASAEDYEIDDRSGAVVFGERKVSAFCERWSLQRTIGTHTGSYSLADQQCPRCGAPLAINEIGECEYCSAAVTSGAFDWVLSHIAQHNE